jgi:hypothetical protein
MRDMYSDPERVASSFIIDQPFPYLPDKSCRDQTLSGSFTASKDSCNMTIDPVGVFVILIIFDLRPLQGRS